MNMPQQPTGQPNWPTPQPIPPPVAGRRPGGWKRGLVIIVCAVVGWFIGGMGGALFGLADLNVGTALMLVGMWLGLAAGIVFGVTVTRRPRQPRQPIDPAQYPNRNFRRV